MMWHGGWSWTAWLAMTVSMLVFWALVAWVIVIVVRSLRSGAPPETAESILAERFARGELTDAEYEDKLARLRR